MAILFTIIFMLFLNIIPLAFIVTGIVILRTENPKNGKTSGLRLLAIALIILGVAYIVHGLYTGYGLQ